MYNGEKKTKVNAKRTLSEIMLRTEYSSTFIVEYVVARIFKVGGGCE